ncbi:MAG TPA: hypothetical protein VFZ25_07630 [Chloroflexota bacterium]|nr:hypothetical protein [Chloroflexota bacterium]
MATIEKTRVELERLLGEFDEKHARERQPLVQAIEKLSGSSPGRRRPGRTKSSKAESSGAPKRRKRSGGVTRREQMLIILDEKPGASSKTVSNAMGIAPNYVYRVKGELEDEGLVVSEGRKLALTKAGAKAADDLRRQFAATKGSGSKASRKAGRGKTGRKVKGKPKGKGSGAPRGRN